MAGRATQVARLETSWRRAHSRHLRQPPAASRISSRWKRLSLLAGCDGRCEQVRTRSSLVRPVYRRSRMRLRTSRTRSRTTRLPKHDTVTVLASRLYSKRPTEVTWPSGPLAARTLPPSHHPPTTARFLVCTWSWTASCLGRDESRTVHFAWRSKCALASRISRYTSLAARGSEDSIAGTRVASRDCLRSEASMMGSWAPPLPPESESR